MNFIKKLSTLALGFMVLAGTAFAQGQQEETKKITDAELENVVNLVNAAQEIQQESQQKMQKIVQNEGLELQRFQVIMQSKQNPKAADSIEVTEKEEKAIANIQSKMAKMNQKAQQEFLEAVEENGLTQKRYQEIAQALQSDPKVAQRFQEMQAEQQQTGSEVNDS